MRNLGRTIAAFTIWSAAAAVAQTAVAQPLTAAPAKQPAANDISAGDSIAVAPMTVAQVSVAPAAPVPAPTPAVTTTPLGPAPMVAVPQAVYVTDFIAVPAGAPPSGLLARLRAALHARAAGHDAGLVAQAVVQRLNHAGLAARYLAPGEPPPVQGWLIGGAFHLESPAANGAASDGTGLPTGALGADVSVTVADLEHNADTPFAVIGVPPGQADGSSKWQPYVVPAKLGFERADRNAAVAALARQIADAFVGNMTALRQADAKAISP